MDLKQTLWGVAENEEAQAKIVTKRRDLLFTNQRAAEITAADCRRIGHDWTVYRIEFTIAISKAQPVIDGKEESCVSIGASSRKPKG